MLTVSPVRGDVKIPLLKLATFCRNTSNVYWWSFVDQLHPHHILGSKVTWVTTASCCYTILGNAFLLNGGSTGLNISRMQAFIRLPTEFDNLLLNAACYFDVSPYIESTRNPPSTSDFQLFLPFSPNGVVWKITCTEHLFLL